MLTTRKKNTVTTSVGKKDQKEILPHHFLCNQEDIAFTEKFDNKNNNFGSISDPIVIANMFSISGRKSKNIPKTLSLTICAGFQKSNSHKGISGNHIIKRDHLTPFTKIYKKTDQWQVLVCVTKQLFADINNIAKNDRMAMAWAPEECAFVLVIDTEKKLGFPRYVLCTFYFNSQSLLMMGTLYATSERTVKLVTHGNKRYISVPLNTSIIQNASAKKADKWVLKSNDQIPAAPIANESSITNSTNNNTYDKLTQQLAVMSMEDFDPAIFTDTASYGELIFKDVVKVDMELDEFSGAIMFNINKYCQDIIMMMDDELSMMADFQKKWVNCIEALVKFKEDKIVAYKEAIKNASLENPDSLATYVQEKHLEYALTLREFIDSADSLIFEKNEIRYKQYETILEKIMALQNQLVSCYLDDEMQLRWRILNQCEKKFYETYTIMMKVHDDAVNLLLLCKCAYLKPMSSFLCQAIKQQRIPHFYLKFMGAIKVMANEQDLESECKETGNAALFNFFREKLKIFDQQYPEFELLSIQNDKTKGHALI